MLAISSTNAAFLFFDLRYISNKERTFYLSDQLAGIGFVWMVVIFVVYLLIWGCCYISLAVPDSFGVVIVHADALLVPWLCFMIIDALGLSLYFLQKYRSLALFPRICYFCWIVSDIVRPSCIPIEMFIHIHTPKIPSRTSTSQPTYFP